VSIRWRITALASGAMLVVLLLAGFGILRAHERALVNALDERLDQSRAAYERDGELVPPGDEDSLAQLVRAGRVVEIQPASAADVHPELLDTPIAEGPPAGDDQAIQDIAVVLPGEGEYRVLSAGVGTDEVLHLAANLDDVHDSASALRRALALSVPLVVLALGAVIWWFVGRTLQPVEAIRAQVGVIGGGDLHRRVPVPAADDEVGRLARTMNDMLERLERAAEQQRRFVADASHELRSPLARMRAELEVDLAHPEGADLQATHQSALEEVVGLQHLVDDLLDLARHEGVGTPAAPREPVDLDDLVQRAARRVRASGRVRLDTSGVGAAQVQGDPGQLGRLVTNLLDNAVRHAASTVAISLRQDDDATAELVVADDGPGIADADRTRVFEPFTRLDEARTAGTGGAGLGLTIVRDIALAHGGTVTVEDHPGGGARFVVNLPAAGAPA
jgi:signal transduction histidine kinase